MEENKKPGGGSRDISDLKARLGLKKGGTTPPGAGPQGGAPVAAPPTAGANVPSPFAQPAAPSGAPAAQATAAPDPTLAAQQQQMANLAAFYGLGQAPPGTADAGAGESITKQSALSKFLPVIIGCLLAFVVGNVFARIFAGRGDYNKTTEDAAKIRDEVDKLSKALITIGDTLKTGKGEIDFDMVKKLGELPLVKPDTKAIFHTNYYSLDDMSIERLFQYYNDTIQLYDELQRHAKTTETDRAALESYQKSGAGKLEKNYGVTLDLTTPVPRAQFAELGEPVCPGGAKDCPPADLKLKYRTASGGGWGERPVKGKPGETIIPIERSDLFLTTASGSADVLAFKGYANRMRNIVVFMARLQEGQKQVTADLKKAAERPHLLAF